MSHVITHNPEHAFQKVAQVALQIHSQDQTFRSKLSPPPPAAVCRGLTAAASAAANSLQSRSAPRRNLAAKSRRAVCTSCRAGFALTAPSLQKCRDGPARFQVEIFNRQVRRAHFCWKLKAGSDVERDPWDIYSGSESAREQFMR